LMSWPADWPKAAGAPASNIAKPRFARKSFILWYRAAASPKSAISPRRMPGADRFGRFRGLPDHAIRDARKGTGKALDIVEVRRFAHQHERPKRLPYVVLVGSQISQRIAGVYCGPLALFQIPDFAGNAGAHLRRSDVGHQGAGVNVVAELETVAE